MNDDLGFGVKYEDSEYLGLLSRLVILVLDLGAVFIILGLGVYFNEIYLYDNYITYTAIFICYLYLTIVKTSSIGTLGQIVTQSRILTIYGKKPSFIRMNFRLLFWTIGPMNTLSDIAFMTFIREKRTLRDCYSDTIVIKKNALPIETDIPVYFTRIFALGLNIMYRSCYSKNS